MLDIIGATLMTLFTGLSVLMLAPLLGLLFRHPKLDQFNTSLAQIFQKIIHIIAHIAMWGVLIMALAQLLVVLLRYVFGLNFLWLQDGILYLHGALFLLSAGYVLLNNEHVRVDLFYREASAHKKAWVDFVGTYIFLFPVCILLVWAAGPYVARSWAVMERSTEATGIHAVFILKSLIPAFGTLLMMAGFVIAHRTTQILRLSNTEVK